MNTNLYDFAINQSHQYLLAIANRKTFNLVNDKKDDSSDDVDAFTISTVLSIIFSKPKEVILMDIINKKD